MIRVSGGLGAAVLSVLACGMIVAAPVEAATVSGSNLEASPGGAICAYSEPTSCTLMIFDLPVSSQAPGGAHAGASGVIVGWKVRTAAGPSPSMARLRVVHGTKGGGAGPVETVPAGAGTYAYSARVGVQAGDLIGLDVLDATISSSVRMLSLTPEASAVYWKPTLGEGEESPIDGEFAGEMLMNATIEPDADGDGFGDESQDGCPNFAGASIPPCVVPQPASETPPDTKIANGPKGKIESHRAKFKFSSEPPGARFECKLDRKSFTTCRSPKIYRGLVAGKHTFRVRAVSASGLSDTSPAKRLFRVAP
jgi:hypothetical protein